VVGGGPAGLFAAQQLAQAGFQVTVYDRMPSVGRKLLLAGRGGLNLTHSEPSERFLTRYGTDGSSSLDSILDAVRTFDSEALRRWADDLGAETFIGTSGRVFPKALRATPLLRAWLQKLTDLGVRFEGGWEFAGFAAPLHSPGPIDESAPTSSTIQQAHWTGARVVLHRRPPKASVAGADDRSGVQRLELAMPVLLALGGASWPRLGADGLWVPAFRDAGIGVNDLRASNCGLRVNWSSHMTQFCGQPLKNVALSINGVTKRGELLIDPKGIEGSAAYAIGSSVAQALRSEVTATVELDLRADVSVEHLQARLLKRTGKMSTSTWLTKHGGLSAAAVAVLREIYASPAPSDSGEMARAIKQVPLVVQGTFPIERAISTAGGVSLNAINEHFMLNSHPGVFVAGEMLDWDAPTGGYLLQACFATGSAAATGIANYG
jgi:predicted flavoprotein YhiN